MYSDFKPNALFYRYVSILGRMLFMLSFRSPKIVINMKKLILPLSLALTAMTPATATVVVDYDFTDGSWTTNSVQAVKDAGFTVNAAGDSDSNVFIGGGSSALVLSDTTNPGFPTATYDFAEGITQGNATFTANSSGSNPYVGQILFLNEGGDTLFGLQLRYETQLYIYADGEYTGSDGPNVLPSGGDITTFNTYGFSWSSNTDGTGGTVNISFNGDDLVGNSIGYRVDGVVSSLQFAAGFSSAGSNRFLRVTTMEVNAIPEPGTTPALFGLGLLGLICAKRRMGK